MNNIYYTFFKEKICFVYINQSNNSRCPYADVNFYGKCQNF